jgi:hypothetical protein
MMTPRQFAGWLKETASPTPLITAGTVALVMTIAGYGGLFGIPLALLMLWGFGNFLFEVVEHRALGRPDWPVISVETFTSLGRQLWLVQVGVITLGVMAYLGVKQLGVAPLDQLVALYMLACLPASIALLAITRAPLKAMSPLHLTATMAKLGLDYLGLLVLTAGALYCAVRLISGMGLLNWMAGILCVLLLFNAIGHVVYRRRADLGLNPVHAPELVLAGVAADLEKQRRHTLTHVYGLISRGNPSRGFTELRKYLDNEDPDPLGARVWFFAQMADWEDPAAALGFGADLITRLVAARDLFTAHKVLLRCAYLDPAFQADGSDQQLLSRWLDAGRPTDLSPP